MFVNVKIKDMRNRYGFLFHPEDTPVTYPLLDNFIAFCKGGKRESDEQKKLQQGKFEHLTSFKKFKYF